MNTKKVIRKQISAFADGEPAEQNLDVVLEALSQPANCADWEIYHQIGDVLRSDDMAITLSLGFAARMAARLDAEPAVVASSVIASTDQAQMPSQLKRWAMPSMVSAAAMAIIAFVITPQLMVALKLEPVTSGATEVAVASVPEEVVLRDPRIDDYLLAHQRFSPSVYSSTQYARSAAFATDSNK